MLPPIAEPGVWEVNQRRQETSIGIESGEEGDNGLLPAPPALPEAARRVAGWLRASADRRDRDWLAGWRPGSPRSVPEPPPSSCITMSVGGDTICISTAPPRADWALIGSAGAEWQAGSQVGTRWPVRPGCRSAPRLAALTFPESRGRGGAVPPSVLRPAAQTPGHSLG